MKTIEQRLLARTKKGVEGECWICSYSLAGHGYPQMKVGGKMEKASRVAYRLWVGEIPPGLFVCHGCDKPKCVNPAHLWVGTNQDNVNDMKMKGRQDPPRGDDHWSRTHPESVARGEKHGRAKLTEEDVRYIRMWAIEGFTHHKIAEAFGISRPQVSAIVRRERWKHIR